jgi:hypothetical protein
MLQTLLSQLSTIEGLFLAGFAPGLLLGAIGVKEEHSFWILLSVPLAVLGYVIWDLSQHTGRLPSTAGLAIFFGPSCPMAGAILGFYPAREVRAIIRRFWRLGRIRIPTQNGHAHQDRFRPAEAS